MEQSNQVFKVDGVEEMGGRFEKNKPRSGSARLVRIESEHRDS
jgi:hypothetical protein